MPELLDAFEDNEEVSLTVNSEFASKYEEKKKSEELSTLRDKYGDFISADLDDSQLEKLASRFHKYGDKALATLSGSEIESTTSSEEEDEVGELVTPEVDAQILRTIAAIRTDDPRVYDPKANFFSEEEMQKLRNEWKEKQKEMKKEKGQTMKLKDFHRKILLEDGGVVNDDDDDNAVKREKTFVEEQQDLKKSFLDAVDGAEEEEDFFSVKQKSKEELEAEEQDYKHFLLQSIGKTDQHALNALEEWRDHEHNKDMDENEKFLIDFVLNRKWMEKPDNKQNWYKDEVSLSEDEEAVEEMEDFEREHNFRFEEENGAQIVTHAREIPGTLRRQDTRRKEARERRKERKEAEKQQKIEELKRLKNLKRNEIWEKLQKIREITGNENVGFDDIDLSKPFDPKDWDAKMSSIFNDKYYDAEDPEIKADPEEGVDLVKPVWKDDIDISDIVKEEKQSDEEEEQVDNKKKSKNKKKKEKKKAKQTAMQLLKQYGDEEAYAPLPEYDDGQTYNEQQHDDQNQGQDQEQDFIMDADYLENPTAPTSSKKLSRREQKRLEKEMRKSIKNFDDYLNQYYQLDFEDMVGDLPTRFKYTSVPKDDFGLSPVEILLADDKDLNEYYSLKKMAPYRNKELVEKDRKRWKKTKKQKLKELREKLAKNENGWTVEDTNSKKNKKRKHDDDKEEKSKKQKTDKNESEQEVKKDKKKKKKQKKSEQDVTMVEG